VFLFAKCPPRYGWLSRARRRERPTCDQPGACRHRLPRVSLQSQVQAYSKMHMPSEERRFELADLVVELTRAATRKVPSSLTPDPATIVTRTVPRGFVLAVCASIRCSAWRASSPSTASQSSCSSIARSIRRIYVNCTPWYRMYRYLDCP
jgi:hypothetical protein